MSDYIVAMSGGVDSSVAAALLLEKSYSIQGVILHLWGDEINDLSVPTKGSLEKAVTIAKTLGINIEIVDSRAMFKKYVIDQFINGYVNGYTPNPCIICNKFIKFGILNQFSKNWDKTNIVTGHYARIIQTENNDYQLFKGVDKIKDQSYFLSMLEQSQLKRISFPLGGLKKDEVWNLAQKYHIELWERSESQDLCFLKNIDYREFLLTNVGDIIKPGKITDRAGNMLGSHNGLAYYTIGQRKGLGVNSKEPLFVLEKDIENNILVIGRREELGKKHLFIKKFNWISGCPTEKTFQADVKIRSMAKLEQAFIYPSPDFSINIEFENLLRDITPGQYAVIYLGDQVLGGGEIA